MKIINISDAKAQLSSLLSRVMSGEEIIISKAGKPIAKIISFSGSTKVRKPGALKGKIKIADDFDELPQDIKEAFGV